MGGIQASAFLQTLLEKADWIFKFYHTKSDAKPEEYFPPGLWGRRFFGGGSIEVQGKFHQVDIAKFSNHNFTLKAKYTILTPSWISGATRDGGSHVATFVRSKIRVGHACQAPLSIGGHGFASVGDAATQQVTVPCRSAIHYDLTHTVTDVTVLPSIYIRFHPRVKSSPITTWPVCKLLLTTAHLSWSAPWEHYALYMKKKWPHAMTDKQANCSPESMIPSVCCQMGLFSSLSNTTVSILGFNF